ncbi:hypothetical protein C6W93_18585 [Mycobacterium kansasii]|nr:hypothetical protein [Mycobacterium kansasii]
MRLRRRLVAYSSPIALVALLAVGKIISTMLTGDAAVSDFARHDIDALRADVATLSTLNVIEPGQAAYVAGDLAVLEGRLDDAERHFTDVLDRSSNAGSCPARVNLELVRETQGDLAARSADISRAEQRYNSALQLISGAPPPGATSTPTPPPPPPGPGGNGPVLGPGGDGSNGGPDVINDVSPDRIPVSGNGSAPSHRLGTGAGSNPLDQLQNALSDADATGASSEDTAAHS